MEVGTTSRSGALILLLALVCAAFAVDRFQTGEPTSPSGDVVAAQSRPVPSASEAPLLLSRAALR